MPRVRSTWVIAAAAAAALTAIAVACATGGLGGGEPDAAVEDAGDSSVADAGGACPQYDLQNDPKHCGACKRACTDTQLCKNGACVAACDAPLAKCPGADAGCVDLKSDPKHCGDCKTACSVSDGGGMTPGNGNDSGILFDGGYDGGIGWTTATAVCDAGGCAVACPGGFTACADTLCYDLQNHHDRCGDCNAACDPSQWCSHGQCCDGGSQACGGGCTNTQFDPKNCGACGLACDGGAPYCTAGACVAGCVPTGTRQAFDTLGSHTTTGCWLGNPCAQDQYNFAQTNGQNFQALGQQFVCSGAPACVGHVGIGTYVSQPLCQGTWDVYCDATKVGSLSTLNKTCTGSAMTNGCSISFTPLQCSTIGFVATAGSGVQSCCGGSAPDSMIVAVSAW